MAAPSNININIDFSGISQMISTVFSKLSHLNTVGILFVICAIFMPPLAVLLKVGLTTQFFINVVLTILGIVPGQIHALWVVLFL